VDDVVSMVYGNESSDMRALSPDELLSNSVRSLEVFIEECVTNVLVAIKNYKENEQAIVSIPKIFSKDKDGYYATVTEAGRKRITNSIDQLVYILDRISAMDTAVVTYNSLKMSAVPVIEKRLPIGIAMNSGSGDSVMVMMKEKEIL
jgi:hypothetical protein